MNDHRFEKRRGDEANARINADAVIQQWTNRVSYGDGLYQLFGYECMADFAVGMRDDDRLLRVLRLLAGPNGYTIYKLLLIQQQNRLLSRS